MKITKKLSHNKLILLLITILILSISIANIDSVNATTITSSDDLKSIVESSQSKNRATTINLKSGTYDLSNKTITITGNVTINGLGSGKSRPVLDAKNKNRMFEVDKGSTLTLKNLILTKGRETGRGGAIYSEGTLNIDNCDLIANKVSGHGNDGGAIHSQYGSVSIKNSMFVRNTAINDGGAIDSYNSRLSITKSYFNKNHASKGGAISYFNGLNADRNRNKLAIEDSRFTENTGKGESSSGGAIDISNADVIISNCIFTKNTAINNGGAMKAHTSKVSISSSTFKENRANEGGAVYSSGSLSNNLGASLTINKCTFTKNTATASIKTGGNGGGAILSDNALKISNSVFSKNKANQYKNKTYKEKGGGAISHFGSLAIDKTIFTGNTANFGGVINMNDASHGSITRSTFTKNTGTNRGSVIYCHTNTSRLSSNPTKSKITVSKSVFSGNKGKHILYQHEKFIHTFSANNNYWGKNMTLKKVRSLNYRVNISRLAKSPNVIR